MVTEATNRIPGLERISYFAALFAAFSFSFPQQLMNFGYVLWMIIWAVEIIFRKNIRFEKPSKQNIHLYLMLAYFAWFLISLLWTSNFQEAEKVFTRRISLLVFPLLSLFGMNRNFRLKHFLLAFLLGSLVSFVYFQTENIHNYFKLGKTFIAFESFYDGLVAPYKHRTFFSVSLILSLLFAYSLKDIFISKMGKVLFWLFYFQLNIAFVLYIFSSGGRMALIIYLLVIAALIVMQLWEKGYKKSILIVGILFIGGLALGLKYNPRMPKVTELSEQSLFKIDPRYYMWKSSLTAAKENFILGAGIGDRKDAFLAAYDKIEDPQKREATSTHNNFIDNQLELGLIGTLLLLGIIICSLWNTNKYNRLMILLVSFTWIMTSLIESTGSISPIYLFMFYLLLIRFFKEEPKAEENKGIQKTAIFIVAPLVLIALALSCISTYGRFNMW